MRTRRCPVKKGPGQMPGVLAEPPDEPHAGVRQHSAAPPVCGRKAPTRMKGSGSCEVCCKPAHENSAVGSAGGRSPPRQAAFPEAWTPFASTSHFPLCTYTYI